MSKSLDERPIRIDLVVDELTCVRTTPQNLASGVAMGLECTTSVNDVAVLLMEKSYVRVAPTTLSVPVRLDGMLPSHAVS